MDEAIVWRMVDGVPNIDVSDTGIVRAYWERRYTHDGMVKVPITEPRILKQYLSTTGYFYVAFTDDRTKRYRKYFVHRLVLMAHIGPCQKGREACHRDGSRTNNVLSNLYWGTRQQNCLDTSSQRRNRKSKLTPEQVKELVGMYDSGVLQKDLAIRFGINSASVSNLLRSRGRGSHGHRAYVATITPEQVRQLRDGGLMWFQVAEKLNISEGFARRLSVK